MRGLICARSDSAFLLGALCLRSPSNGPILLDRQMTLKGSALGSPRTPSLVDPANMHLSFWRDGQRQTYSGADFWNLVSAYMALLTGNPTVGRLGLIVSRTSPDMLALFLAMIACRRMVSF